MTDAAAPQPSPQDLVADRRAKLARLRDELGIDPFGGRIDGIVTLAAARAQYDEQADADHKADAANDRRPILAVAGRVVLHRDIGKLVFMTVRDATGDLQVAVNKRDVDDQTMKLAKLADLGDIVTAHGPLAKTKTGEITLWARNSPKAEGLPPGSPPGFSIAAKSLTPPPSEHYGFANPEQRYRQRYVDLWANPDVMRTLQLRIRIIDEIRSYLRNRGFVEVETPMLQPIHGGAAARPFKTHHNALDLPLFLRIAPELYLKRLLVGGFPKVFEINRNFRNEGISPRHNPEFTMLEAYEAFGSWETMADLVEDMVCTVALNVFGTLQIEAPHVHAGLQRTINLRRPWRRVSMADLVEERTGWRFDKQSLTPKQIQELQRIQANQFLMDEVSAEQMRMLGATQVGKDLKLHGSPAEQLVEVYEKLIEPTLIDPCFVTHVPGVIIPLAKRCKDDDYFADVYELAINGQEISPGYSELNDPDVQEQHFRGQVGDREEQQQVDEDFLHALRVGMPPAGGMGLGIDRLVMMLTGAASIRDVILFPLMRPQG